MRFLLRELMKDFKIDSENIQIYSNKFLSQRNYVKKICVLDPVVDDFLKVWRSFFSFAKVYGVSENLTAVPVYEDRIVRIKIDTTNPDLAAETCLNNCDIIIDQSKKPIKYFKILFSKLKANGGVYIIEDVSLSKSFFIKHATALYNDKKLELDAQSIEFFRSLIFIMR